jgi:ElaB/YqjD/DUF883 family membrane-anchored ribosome-binding protein
MAEPMRDPVSRMPSQSAQPMPRVSTGATEELFDRSAAATQQLLERGSRSTQELFERLQRRWEELKDRIANPTAVRLSLTRELRDDMDYVRARARYYHEDRPLQAVAMVAGAAFALGLVLGLLRRR